MEEELDCEASGAELIKNDDRVWFPMILQASHEDATGSRTRYHTICVNLPSGTDHKGMTDVRVEPDERTVRLECEFPVMMQDAKLLMKKWLQDPDPATRYAAYHPEFLAINSAFSELRARSTDKITCVARIPLPFQVERKLVSINRVGDKAGARIIVIRLKEASNNYVDAVDDGSFEIA